MSQKQKSNNEETTIEDSIVNQEDNITTEDNNSTKEPIISEKTEQQKKSSVKRTILALVVLVVVGGIGSFVYTSQIKSNKPSERFEQRVVIDYTKFIDSWNKQVQNNTSKREFLLSRDSNEKMMKQLENWMKIFYIPKVTDSSKYNQFLEKNKFGKPTYFDITMSRDKIRELLKKDTKEKVMSKIVKKVLMMNDMELWEKLGKKDRG